MSSEFTYKEVNQYIRNLVPDRHEELRKMESYARDEQFPIIGPAVGNMCYMIARMINARNIFEMGSGFGYSTAWFARAVRENGGGQVHHTVWDETMSLTAKTHMENLGYTDIVTFHVSEAIQALNKVEDSFDLIFNDIDKEFYPQSLPVIESKLRSGGILIVDNMIWGGTVMDESVDLPGTRGIREFTRLITTSPHWISTLIPIRDGVMVAFKR